MNKKTKKITVISLISVTIIGLGLWSFLKYNTKDSKPTVKNITITAEKKNLTSKVQATGVIFSSNTKEIVSNNSGEIKNLTLKEGDTVKQGQPLCTVFNEQLIQQVDNATLDLEKQKLQSNNEKSDTSEELQNLLIEEVEKKLQYAKNAKNKMIINSPIAGLIISMDNKNGDNIQSGKTILTVANTSSLKVNLSVDELDISKIKKGQKVKVTANSIKDKNYEGVVESISQSGTTENNVTIYNVVVALKDSKDLKLGMTVNSEILIETKTNVLTVPPESIIEKNDKKFVTVLDPTSSQSSLKEIRTGMETEDNVEILEGINEGEHVIIRLPNTTEQTTNKMKMNSKYNQKSRPMSGNKANKR